MILFQIILAAGMILSFALPTTSQAATASSVGAGYAYTCALTTVGGVKCWGENLSGVLGDGTGGSLGAESWTPVDVLEAPGGSPLGGVAAVSGGYTHACAVITGVGVKCWGYNSVGQLGDGTNLNSTTPVYVLVFDSDGDGLPDAIDPDPFDPDSDGDGIVDGSDPDSLAAIVVALPPGVFANRGDPMGQRNAILSRLEDIERLILAGDTAGAIRALRNLLRRVDGCGPSADRDDWIIDCVNQIRVRDLIRLLITNLGG